MLCNDLVMSSKILIRMVVVVDNEHKRIVVLAVSCGDFRTILVHGFVQFRVVRNMCVVRCRLYVQLWLLSVSLRTSVGGM